VDWALVCELAGDARTPYSVLARKFGLSLNTVKNRINKLQKKKVLGGSAVFLSMEMLGADHVTGVITTDGTEEVIEFMEHIVTQPMIAEIYRTSDRRYEYWAIVVGAKETLGLKQFLTEIEGVLDVEMNPQIFLLPNKPPNFYLNTRGKKVTFTRTQLQVLQCIKNKARMPVSQIAEQTGFTSKRIRKTLRELEEGGGVHFTRGYNVFALGDMEYRLRIEFDSGKTTGQKLIKAIYEMYPDEIWWAGVLTNKPIVNVGLILDRPGKCEPIVRAIRGVPHIQSVEDFLSYPRVVRPNFPLYDGLNKILADANL
jgi:DNA-binding Lrp family transcriptional regulator